MDLERTPPGSSLLEDLRKVMEYLDGRAKEGLLQYYGFHLRSPVYTKPRGSENPHHFDEEDEEGSMFPPELLLPDVVSCLA